jgi:hypothetical protein
VSEEISVTTLHKEAEEAGKSGDRTAAAVYRVGEAICQRLKELRSDLSSLDSIWMEVNGLRNDLRSGDLPR